MATLANSPADVVAQLLIQLGLAVDPATTPGGPWSVHVVGQPGKPDRSIVVGNTAGKNDGRSGLDGTVWRHWGIGINVRSFEESDGWLKADAIRDALERQVRYTSVTLPAATGGHTYLVYAIADIGQVISAGKETPQSKRSLFSLNCTVTLTQTS